MGDSGTLYQTLNPFSGFFRHDTPVVATVPGHYKRGTGTGSRYNVYTADSMCDQRATKCQNGTVLYSCCSCPVRFNMSILISNVAARLAVGLRLTIVTALLQ